ncbi:ADP-ribosylglycohydrolase family protein [Priestia megaterium]|uniref:ADP-ribosylglycohydrolase family protein n=1 Tax=Priestia megaterium TaxID=1404 RepID=UPI000BF8A119|nr:ADP-ribosylglycohydrolase family protein [Priestia megaterium]RCX25052.1 ADP-ribosylglycohydrolase [Bacillus sp. AG236]TCN11081.1 ADP-ribosylglycohydrolase [Bacillus sp. BK006]MDC7721628.1 ADP-ribosylglycohydrolase family protein [Priestia megaterium]MEB2291972.1 ADP-ribosylglycohydrolase family protein [Priestia megaterium]PFL01717.1 ADP-ribosylglycohydrolase [Priestia megaterium]
MTLHKKVLSTILGGAVGDALGVPVEFKKRDSFRITTMTGYGTYNQPKGTWSDDTSLTMCLIDNLLEKQDEYDLMQKFESYWANGYWTPYGEMFDIGIATSEAIRRYNSGLPKEEWGGSAEYDNGNGALMRIAPLAFTLRDEPSFTKRKEEIERIAHVTHRHVRSTLGCIIYVELLIRLLDGNEPFEAYENAVNLCQKQLTGTEYEVEFSAYERVLNLSLPHAARNEIGSTGYVVSSLEASLWSFLQSDDYKEAVLTAVNLGEDTDTIGFITGTMAGVYYELDGIPEEWICQLAKKEELEKACKKFADIC